MAASLPTKSTSDPACTFLGVQGLGLGFGVLGGLGIGKFDFCGRHRRHRAMCDLRMAIASSLGMLLDGTPAAATIDGGSRKTSFVTTANPKFERTPQPKVSISCIQTPSQTAKMASVDLGRLVISPHSPSRALFRGGAGVFCVCSLRKPLGCILPQTLHPRI